MDRIMTRGGKSCLVDVEREGTDEEITGRMSELTTSPSPPPSLPPP